MKNRKLKIGKRDVRTERQRALLRPRALLGARPRRHGGHSPARRGRGSPVPVPGASLSCSRPRRASPGRSRPPLPPSGVPRSLGPARQNGSEREARRPVRAGGSPRAEPRGFPAGWGAEPPAPRLYLLLRETRRREGGPWSWPETPVALPTASLRGRRRRARDLGRAGRPPNRGDRGLSSLSDY